MKGKFIVIEGPDGAGKSTVCKAINEILEERGYNSFIIRDPGGTPAAEKIRDIVKNNKLSTREYTLLFMASRCILVNNEIIPAVNEGKIVLCDRFFRSTFIYQGWYDNPETDEFFKVITEYADYGVAPDIEFVLNVDAKTAWDRIIARGNNIDVFKQRYDFTSMINEQYKNIERSKAVFTHPVYEIDANQPLDKVVSDIIAVLVRYGFSLPS